MEDRGLITNVLCWLFTSFGICFVILRLLSRLVLSDYKGWDDLFICISLVSKPLPLNTHSYWRASLSRPGPNLIVMVPSSVLWWLRAHLLLTLSH